MPARSCRPAAPGHWSASRRATPRSPSGSPAGARRALRPSSRAHLLAQRGVDVGELEADVAGADDGQPVGQPLHLERVVRGEHRLAVHLLRGWVGGGVEPGRGRRPGSGASLPVAAAGALRSRLPQRLRMPARRRRPPPPWPAACHPAHSSAPRGCHLLPLPRRRLSLLPGWAPETSRRRLTSMPPGTKGTEPVAMMMSRAVAEPPTSTRPGSP